MRTAEFVPTVTPALARATHTGMTEVCGCGHRSPNANRQHGVPGQSVKPNSQDYVWCSINVFTVPMRRKK